jgi:hypothetical protein
MKLFESLKNMIPKTPVVDPSRFGDPLAMQTKRTRIQRDAANIAAFIGCPLWDGLDG